MHILCVVYDTVFVNTKVKMCPVIQLLLASTLGIKDIKLLKIIISFTKIERSVALLIINIIDKRTVMIFHSLTKYVMR